MTSTTQPRPPALPPTIPAKTTRDFLSSPSSRHTIRGRNCLRRAFTSAWLTSLRNTNNTGEQTTKVATLATDSSETRTKDRLTILSPKTILHRKRNDLSKIRGQRVLPKDHSSMRRPVLPPVRDQEATR
jgi:hypothetical protein